MLRNSFTLPYPAQVLHYSPTLLVGFHAVPAYPAGSGTTPQTSTHPRPVMCRLHHRLPCCMPPRTPHPSLLGGSPRGDEEAPSFVCPGLHRGETGMCCESWCHASVSGWGAGALHGGGGGVDVVACAQRGEGVGQWETWDDVGKRWRGKTQVHMTNSRHVHIEFSSSMRPLPSSPHLFRHPSPSQRIIALAPHLTPSSFNQCTTTPTHISSGPLYSSQEAQRATPPTGREVTALKLGRRGEVGRVAQRTGDGVGVAHNWWRTVREQRATGWGKVREQAQFGQVGKMCGVTRTPAGEREHSGMFRSRQGLVARCGASGGRECTQA